MAKKKKKKKPKGAQRSTYAKGKMVEETGAGKAAGAAPAKKAAGGAAQAQKGRGAGPAKQAQTQQWNVVRQGSLEMKVMLSLLFVVALAALLQYPLRSTEARIQYGEAQKDLKIWEQKYKTKEEQKKHEKEKPALPPKPTGGVLLIGILFAVIESAVLAFLGLNISRRTDLGTHLLDKAQSGGGVDFKDLRPFLTYSVPAGAVMLLPMMLGAKISASILSGLLKASETKGARYPLWKVVLGSVNDGVFYQLLFVFLAMSGFVWLFTRYRDRTRVEPHWAGIAAAFLFAVGFVFLNVRSGGALAQGHVSASKMLTYALSLALPVWLLGYLYWKKGLEYSLLAGVVGFGLYPILASFIVK